MDVPEKPAVSVSNVENRLFSVIRLTPSSGYFRFCKQPISVIRSEPDGALRNLSYEAEFHYLNESVMCWFVCD